MSSHTLMSMMTLMMMIMIIVLMMMIVMMMRSQCMRIQSVMVYQMLHFWTTEVEANMISYINVWLYYR